MFKVKTFTQNEYLFKILKFLITLEVPKFDSEQNKKRFLKKSVQFFVKNKMLFKRNKEKPLKVILNFEERFQLMIQAHEELGHRGEFATNEILRRRFY